MAKINKYHFLVHFSQKVFNATDCHVQKISGQFDMQLCATKKGCKRAAFFR